MLIYKKNRKGLILGPRYIAIGWLFLYYLGLFLGLKVPV